MIDCQIISRRCKILPNGNDVIFSKIFLLPSTGHRYCYNKRKYIASRVKTKLRNYCCTTLVESESVSCS
jgi:hypothetical protein